MDTLAQPLEPAWLIAAIGMVLTACAMIWLVIGVRLWLGLPLIPYQPRRPVPWGSLHILLVVAVHMLAATAAMLIIRQCWPAITAAEAVKTGDANTKHVIVQMLQAYHQYPALFLVAAFAAVVVAPIIEEFFFRVLLQGWLETMERRHRFAMRLFRPTVLVGVAPIVLSSLLFAAAHFHFARAEPPALVIAAGLIANAIGEIVAVTAVIVLVLRQRGVTAFDFGWAPEKLASDVGLGLLAYLAIYVPVYIIQFVCAQIMPAGVAPDPVALFILALVLGTLYYRTHRIVPSIVTHAAFNATTLLLLWGITPS